MKKHPEQNEQFEAQLRNLPDTVNQSLAGLTAGTELNNRIQMAVRDSRASRQKKSFPVRRFVSVAGVCAAAVALFVGLSPLLSSPANAPLIQSSPLGDKPTATERTLRADLTGQRRIHRAETARTLLPQPMVEQQRQQYLPADWRERQLLSHDDLAAQCLLQPVRRKFRHDCGVHDRAVFVRHECHAL